MTVKEVLEAYGKDFVEELKRKIVEEGGVATETMIKSLNSDVEDDPDGWTLVLWSVPYLKWYDSGTRPHWMPIEPLKVWVDKKGIVPEERNGKLPTVEQLPYLIQHGIAEHGTPEHDVLNSVANAVLIRWEPKLHEAMVNEITDLMKGLPIKY